MAMLRSGSALLGKLFPPGRFPCGMLSQTGLAKLCGSIPPSHPPGSFTFHVGYTLQLGKVVRQQNDHFLFPYSGFHFSRPQ
ncbi:MAG: hypothetical protein QNJ68_23785 [Microcoleaceae cyanobacterium MO_207.B10]|nr:hypothetical protein [Microcoleaceae cyanobacterium MO_207.B10]